MVNEYEDSRQLVSSEALANQTTLVEELRNRDVIEFWDITSNGQQGTPEVFEWWLVTESFANLLADEGEIIVNKFGCLWWGRTTTGQAIHVDAVIEEIVEKYYKEPDVDPTRVGARG